MLLSPVDWSTSFEVLQIRTPRETMDRNPDIKIGIYSVKPGQKLQLFVFDVVPFNLDNRSFTNGVLGAKYNFTVLYN